MSKILLFMCPHNAAKSVLAVAFAQQQLVENNIQGFEIKSAGTEPDKHVSSNVAQYLKKQGFDISHQTPRKVTVNDLSSAHKIISMGCDLQLLDKYADKLLDWEDVPPTDVDLGTSAQLIAQRVDELVSSLG